MALLHTVNKSPFERDTLDACLRLARPGAGVLLIEDAVYAALQGTKIARRISEATRSLALYALEPDLKARGCDVNLVIEGVRLVGYEGFVDLAVRYRAVQTWL